MGQSKPGGVLTTPLGKSLWLYFLNPVRSSLVFSQTSCFLEGSWTKRFKADSLYWGLKKFVVMKAKYSNSRSSYTAAYWRPLSGVLLSQEDTCPQLQQSVIRIKAQVCQLGAH